MLSVDYLFPHVQFQIFPPKMDFFLLLRNGSVQAELKKLLWWNSHEFFKWPCSWEPFKKRISHESYSLVQNLHSWRDHWFQMAVIFVVRELCLYYDGIITSFKCKLNRLQFKVSEGYCISSCWVINEQESVDSDDQTDEKLAESPAENSDQELLISTKKWSSDTKKHENCKIQGTLQKEVPRQTLSEDQIDEKKNRIFGRDFFLKINWCVRNRVSEGLPSKMHQRHIHTTGFKSRTAAFMQLFDAKLMAHESTIIFCIRLDKNWSIAFVNESAYTEQNSLTLVTALFILFRSSFSRFSSQYFWNHISFVIIFHLQLDMRDRFLNKIIQTWTTLGGEVWTSASGERTRKIEIVKFLVLHR